MADWARGMARTYEFWRVNPLTWGDAERIETITGATIKRDDDLETLGSASFEMDAWEGEMYVRTYLVTIQDGVRERWPIGTHLLIADSRDFDGMRGSSTVQGFSPLKVLLDNKPPAFYTLGSTMHADDAARLVRAHSPIPTIGTNEPFAIDAYTADPDSDNWLTFIKGYLAKGGQRIRLDTLGRVLFCPIADKRSLMPAYMFDDGNSSILRPAVSVSSNMADVPNVVEVLHSEGSGYLLGKAENDSPGSLTSTSVRGRTVLLRETGADLPANPTQVDVDNAAVRLLRDKGATAYEVKFTHAFRPDIEPGMAIRLNYSRMGLDTVAVIASQSISCTPACQVECTARFTTEVIAA